MAAAVSEFLLLIWTLQLNFPLSRITKIGKGTINCGAMYTFLKNGHEPSPHYHHPAPN